MLRFLPPQYHPALHGRHGVTHSQAAQVPLETLLCRPCLQTSRQSSSWPQAGSPPVRSGSLPAAQQLGRKFLNGDNLGFGLLLGLVLNGVGEQLDTVVCAEALTYQSILLKQPLFCPIAPNALTFSSRACTPPPHKTTLRSSLWVSSEPPPSPGEHGTGS